MKESAGEGGGESEAGCQDRTRRHNGGTLTFFRSFFRVLQ